MKLYRGLKQVNDTLNIFYCAKFEPILNKCDSFRELDTNCTEDVATILLDNGLIEHDELMKLYGDKEYLEDSDINIINNWIDLMYDCKNLDELLIEQGYVFEE